MERYNQHYLQKDGTAYHLIGGVVLSLNDVTRDARVELQGSGLSGGPTLNLIDRCHENSMDIYAVPLIEGYTMKVTTPVPSTKSILDSLILLIQSKDIAVSSFIVPRASNPKQNTMVNIVFVVYSHLRFRNVISKDIKLTNRALEIYQIMIPVQELSDIRINLAIEDLEQPFISNSNLEPKDILSRAYNVLDKERLEVLSIRRKDSPREVTSNELKVPNVDSQIEIIPCTSMFPWLSDEMIHRIFIFLKPKEIWEASLTCQALWQNRARVIYSPGLRAELFQHQLMSLDWMTKRERNSYTKIEDPSIKTFRLISVSEKSFDVNLINGTVNWLMNNADNKSSFDDSYFGRIDTKGGLFCDEPGLGKTVTILALIASSIGCLPNPNAHVNSKPNTSDKWKGLRSAENRRREVNPNSLIASHGTLIVVPDPLIEHWRDQIKLHLNPNAIHGGIWIDDVRYVNELPPAEYLRKFGIVVTTCTRLSREWKTGKPKCALEHRRPKYFDEDIKLGGSGPPVMNLSELLKIHWLRIVIDEGHSLGTLSSTNLVDMSICLEAERRWVMTGTPTPITGNDNLKFLHGLLRFLRDPLYGTTDDALWQYMIQRSLYNNTQSIHSTLKRVYAGNLLRASSFRNLLNLLRRVMMRHTKESIDIPKPAINRKGLALSIEELVTYNNVVAVARSNLVITNLIGGSNKPGKDHPDSLLHPRQRKYLNDVFYNIRLSCCGGGTQVMHITNKDMMETELFASKYGADNAGVEKVRQYMLRIDSNQNSNCEKCRMSLKLLLVIPTCSHLACYNCLDSFGGIAVCPVCRSDFNVDDFQRLQPGFKADWDWSNSKIETNTIATVVEDGILTENQIQRAKEDLWQSVSKIWYLVGKLRKLRSARIPSSKATYIQTNLMWKHKSPPTTVPCKIVVFSQFSVFLKAIDDALDLFGFNVARFWGKNSAMELTSFKNNPDIQVLLLPKSGAYGLDLSFVTHMFLMEEIWDRSLENQIISRAYRMGAVCSLNVEKLCMLFTIEELMHSMGNNAELYKDYSNENRDKSSITNKSDKRNLEDVAKLHYLFHNLRTLGDDVLDPTPNPNYSPNSIQITCADEEKSDTILNVPIDNSLIHFFTNGIENDFDIQTTMEPQSRKRKLGVRFAD